MLLRHTHTRPVCVGWRRRKCPGMYHVCEVWMIGWHGCKGALRNLVGVLHGSVQWHGWGYVHMVFRFFVQVSCAWWRFKVRGVEFNPFSFGLLLEFRHTYDAQKLHKEGSQYNFFIWFAIRLAGHCCSSLSSPKKHIHTTLVHIEPF